MDQRRRRTKRRGTNPTGGTSGVLLQSGILHYRVLFCTTEYYSALQSTSHYKRTSRDESHRWNKRREPHWWNKRRGTNGTGGPSGAGRTPPVEQAEYYPVLQSSILHSEYYSILHNTILYYRVRFCPKERTLYYTIPPARQGHGRPAGRPEDFVTKTTQRWGATSSRGHTQLRIARTNETKRFPSWTHTPNLRYKVRA